MNEPPVSRDKLVGSYPRSAEVVLFLKHAPEIHVGMLGNKLPQIRGPTLNVPDDVEARHTQQRRVVLRHAFAVILAIPALPTGVSQGRQVAIRRRRQLEQVREGDPNAGSPGCSIVQPTRLHRCGRRRLRHEDRAALCRG